MNIDLCYDERLPAAMTLHFFPDRARLGSVVVDRQTFENGSPDDVTSVEWFNAVRVRKVGDVVLDIFRNGARHSFQLDPSANSVIREFLGVTYALVSEGQVSKRLQAEIEADLAY